MNFKNEKQEQRRKVTVEIQRLTGTPEPIGKEWMSVAYMRAICAQAGLTISAPIFDNGIDLHVGSYKPIGGSGIANAFLALQLKATESWTVGSNNCIKYDLPVKNYNLLRANSICPQYLVLFTLPSEINHWITYQFEHTEHKHVIEMRHMAYYLSLAGKPEVENAETIRVSIPIGNKLTADVLKNLYQQFAQQSWATNQRNNV
ncbi:MAG: hypothetical protein A2Y13_09845 [Planctomycetes bacterium GWC2_45_44]|nr:MAG: hypothetical protein A2Y13_09845 [Planctomycetes bacterium GWC2_45_44]HBR19315.1 hypothetical protein [Phycisphaerales bacterium]